jgi:hypothetical protein
LSRYIHEDASGADAALFAVETSNSSGYDQIIRDVTLTLERRVLDRGP